VPPPLITHVAASMMATMSTDPQISHRRARSFLEVLSSTLTAP
jgi:hypothetical protein